MLWLFFVTSIWDPCRCSLNQCLQLTHWPSGGCSAGTTIDLDYKTHFMHLFHYHLWPSSKWLQINFSYMENWSFFFFHRTEMWAIFISCHFSSHTNIPSTSEIWLISVQARPFHVFLSLHTLSPLSRISFVTSFLPELFLILQDLLKHQVICEAIGTPWGS